MNHFTAFIIICGVISITPLFGAEKTEKEPTASLNTAGTYSRLCEEDDLYGLWKVVRWIPYFEVKGKDWTKPAFLKNQWFLFDGKGGVKSLASNLDIKLDDVKKKLSEAENSISVKFKRKGFMTLGSSGKDAKGEFWRCSIAEKNSSVKALNIELKKGDLIMTEKEPTASLNTAGTYSRLCEEDDLYGLWKVVRWIPYFEVKGKDWTKPAFLKNQWFLFDGKGGVKSLASNLDIKLDDVKKKLSEAENSISVKFKRKGFMTLGSSGKDAKGEFWRCSIAEKNSSVKALNIELKKGDLIMTLFGKDNTIRFFRLLRRVEEK